MPNYSMNHALNNLDEYFNLDLAVPVTGRIIEAIYINDAPAVVRFPIMTYAKYIGTVLNANRRGILFGEGATNTFIQGGAEVVVRRPVPLNRDNQRLLTRSEHPIYWKYAIPLDVSTTPKRQEPPREAAAETPDEGRKYTSPPTPNTVLEFGGKRKTKRRKPKRKSRRR